MGGGSATMAQWKTSVLPSSSWKIKIMTIIIILWVSKCDQCTLSAWCTTTDILWNGLGKCSSSWMIAMGVNVIRDVIDETTIVEKSRWELDYANQALKYCSAWNTISYGRMTFYKMVWFGFRFGSHGWFMNWCNDNDEAGHKDDESESNGRWSLGVIFLSIKMLMIMMIITMIMMVASNLSDGRFLWEGGGGAVHLGLGWRVHGCGNIFIRWCCDD